MTLRTQALRVLQSWPAGTHAGQSEGRSYLVSKTLFNHGRSLKLVAHELGGADYISLNVYYLRSGTHVFPCEMPLEKVLRFLANLSHSKERR